MSRTDHTKVNDKFFFLTVTSESFKKELGGRARRFVQVTCDCGVVKDVYQNSLILGKVKSCGCMKKYLQSLNTHNLSGTRIYEIWASMKKRCDNKASTAWSDYGGRGISYQDSWKDFENFYADMRKNYDESLELDRIDVNGNYSKENCRWVGSGVNAHNRRKRKGSFCNSIGVTLKGSKFKAQLNFSGKVVYRGVFETEEQAAIAYDNASEDYYGDRPNKTKRETHL